MAYNFATADFPHFTNDGGTIVIAGTLDNTGAVLDVGDGTALGDAALAGVNYRTLVGGTIEGGTIEGSSGMSFFADPADGGGTFDGVTYEGVLDLTGPTSELTVINGLTVTDASGTGPGTIEIAGGNSSLTFSGTQTIDAATIDIGSGGALLISGAGAALTLGGDLLVVDTAPDAEIGRGGGVINQGTVNADVAGGLFTIDPTSFTNQGTINVSNGDTLSISTTDFIDLTGATLTGGYYSVAGNSTAWLTDGSSVSTLNADLTLIGEQYVKLLR